MICPADKPIYCRNVLTCESSLYLHRDGARTLCSRRILPHNFPPVLIGHSRDWMCSFGGKQQAHLKCRQNSTLITSTWSLQGNGILHSASACRVTGQNFQLYPATEGHSLSTIEYHDDVRIQQLNLSPIRRCRYCKADSPLMYQSWKIQPQLRNC